MTDEQFNLLMQTLKSTNEKISNLELNVKTLFKNINQACDDINTICHLMR